MFGRGRRGAGVLVSLASPWMVIVGIGVVSWCAYFVAREPRGLT